MNPRRARENAGAAGDRVHRTSLYRCRRRPNENTGSGIVNREGWPFDDMARVAGGAWSSASALREELEARIRERIGRALEGMDLVRRDEFEAVRAMAAKAREENEALAERIAALEAAAAPDAKPRDP